MKSQHSLTIISQLPCPDDSPLNSSLVNIEFSCLKPWLMPMDTREIQSLLLKMRKILNLQASVTAIFCDDAEIAALNKKWLRCQGPTNVISFPCQEDGQGMIWLSLDALWREVELYHQPCAEHMKRLLAHAMCHVAGMDHGEEMEAMEETCLSACSGYGE